MKRYISLLLAALIIAISGCGNSTAEIYPDVEQRIEALVQESGFEDSLVTVIGDLDNFPASIYINVSDWKEAIDGYQALYSKLSEENDIPFDVMFSLKDDKSGDFISFASSDDYYCVLSYRIGDQSHTLFPESLEECISNANEIVKESQTTPANSADESSIQDVSFDPFFTYDGNGDDVVTGLTTEYISFLRVTHLDSGHFAIRAHYDNGDTDLLINTTEPYDGGTTYLPSGKDITLEVTARGAWHVEACRLSISSTDSFSFSNDYVTPIFVPTSSVYHITGIGDGHFAVRIRSDLGTDLLVNTTDPDYDGKVMINYKGEYCCMEIVGKRAVTIEPVS